MTKALIRLRGCAGWSAPLLFANHQRQVFSHRDPYGSSLKLTHKPIHKAMLQNKTPHMTQPSDTKRHLMLYTKLKIWM